MIGLDWINANGKIVAWILVQGFGFDDSDLNIGKVGDYNIGTMSRKGKEERFLITEIGYDDEVFRWNKGDFTSGFNFVLQLSNKYIRFIHTESVAGRIKANKKHVRFNEDKTKFGIPISKVKDIIIQLPIGKFDGYEEYYSEEEEAYVYEDYTKWGKLIGTYNITPLRPSRKWIKTSGKDGKDIIANEFCSTESCSITN